MYDEREILTVGTEIITVNKDRYVIQRVIGGGGSAIVYSATKNNSLRQFVLKECYPTSKFYKFVRPLGVVKPEIPNDEDAEIFLQNVKENILHENQVGEIISMKTGRAVTSWGKLEVEKIIINGKIYDAYESLFIVMEQVTNEDKQRGWFLTDLLDECAKNPSEDAPLRNGGNASPSVAVNIIEELLKSLRDIHNAGYIHGDINDVNFFLMGHDIKTGDIGVGQLLDFGNAKEILADGKTAPISKIFSTPGYFAPELSNIEQGNLRLSPAFDIFAVGCLMLYLFHGMNFKDSCGEDSANFIESIPSTNVIFKHGYRKDSAAFFREILKKALNASPAKRYQNAGDMLDDILKLKKIVVPPQFLLAQNLSRCDYFVEGSRDSEIKFLRSEMSLGKNPLYIYGIAGIGKTELAMEFARRQIKNGMPSYLVTFRGNIKDTIRSLNFSGYEFEFRGANAAEQDYRKRLEILREMYKDCLLIIDNFDDDEKNISELQSDPDLKEFINTCGLKILFTTRSRPNEIAKELQPFDEETALKLFTSISPIKVDDIPIVKELLQEVNYHPMAVEMLAKTREDSWRIIPYKELLTRLRYGRINAESLPQIQIKKKT